MREQAANTSSQDKGCVLLLLSTFAGSRKLCSVASATLMEAKARKDSLSKLLRQ